MTPPERCTVAVVPDAKAALADMRELKELSELYDFDLGIELLRLTQEGLPALCVEIDAPTAVPADGMVCTYKLPERLQVCLAALRVRHLNSNEIKGSRPHRAPKHPEVPKGWKMSPLKSSEGYLLSPLSPLSPEERSEIAVESPDSKHCDDR